MKYSVRVFGKFKSHAEESFLQIIHMALILFHGGSMINILLFQKTEWAKGIIRKEWIIYDTLQPYKIFFGFEKL